MAYHPQPCDTYFVDSHDPYHRQRNHQDLIKIIGRQKQKAMEHELNRKVVVDYMDDILSHMRDMENETIPDVASIEIQQEIKWFMRPYLIDFLIEAHAAFQLLPETLFLAVNLLDRYCSKRVVYKRHYQLVGCASLLIAAKYGDKKERVPLIRELKSMCCGLYDEEMFTQMEWHVLVTLEWTMGHTTPDTWLKLLFREDEMVFDERCPGDVEAEHMSLYLCEIALYHKEHVPRKSSTMARAALALARGILRQPDLECDDHDVNMAIIDLSQQLNRPSQVLYRKYASAHMSGVSVTLDEFLHSQEMARIAALTPPTPVVEVIQRPIVVVDTFPGTPQKRTYGTMINGYITPPITPEGECYTGENPIDPQNQQLKQFQRPTTPTPAGHHQYQQYMY